MPELIRQPNPWFEKPLSFLCDVADITESFLRRALSEIRSRISVPDVSAFAA